MATIVYAVPPEVRDHVIIILWQIAEKHNNPALRIYAEDEASREKARSIAGGRGRLCPTMKRIALGAYGRRMKALDEWVRTLMQKSMVFVYLLPSDGQAGGI